MSLWAILAHDEFGVTVDATGPDPETLADRAASWAQQEEDEWPHMGLVYMLIEPEHLEEARTQERGSAHVDYPHEPGRLFDCSACEAKCHCTPGTTECVFEGEHERKVHSVHQESP